MSQVNHLMKYKTEKIRQKHQGKLYDAWCGKSFNIEITYFQICKNKAFNEQSLIRFWLRATLKGPKKSFVVVLGVETWVRNVSNRTKIVQGNKKCASVAYYGTEFPCLPCINGLMWPCMALYGFMWPWIALYGLVVVFYGHDHVWPH